MKKFCNCKIMVGLIIGLLLSITSVSAVSSYLSAYIYYDNSSSTLASSDIQGAIDELSEKLFTEECPEGYSCVDRAPLQLGEYVLYTPTVTSYTTDSNRTGYTQTINPSELNLWRVISINEDNTVDLISEYVSNTTVSFLGNSTNNLFVYRDYVGYLNELASKYETEGITVGSRYFGYAGQTEFLPSAISITTTAPFTSSTIDNSNERQGGGDILYQNDYDLVYNALGTMIAYKVNTTTQTKYFVASRYYAYINNDTSTSYAYRVGLINTNGELIYNNMGLYNGSGNYSVYGAPAASLRPIVTLKSGLQYTGNGTSESPWTVTS